MIQRDRTWRLEGLSHAPVAGRDRVFLSLRSGSIAAYDQSAQPLWCTSIGAPFDVGGSNGTLRLAGPHLLTQVDDKLVILDPETGAIIHVFRLPASFELPGAATTADTVYLALTAEEGGHFIQTLGAWHLPDGAELWARRIGDSVNELTIVGGTLCATADSRRALVGFDLNDGRERWRVPLADLARGHVRAADPEEQGRAVSGPHSLDGGVLLGLYLHHVIAVDAASGGVRWRTRVPMASPLNAEPIGAGRVVCVASRVFVELAADTGRIESEVSLGGAPPGVGVHPGMLVESASVVFGVESDGVIFALSHTGETLWHHDLRANVPLSLPPRLAYGRLFVTDASGRLHVFTGAGTPGRTDDGARTRKKKRGISPK